MSGWLRCEDPDGEPLRFYGHDVGDGVESIVEATLLDDGSIHLSSVVIGDRG